MAGEVHGLIAPKFWRAQGIFLWQKSSNYDSPSTFLTDFFGGAAINFPAARSGIGDGKFNTQQLVNQLPNSDYHSGYSIPAECHKLRLGGYSDWYMPNERELNELTSYIGVSGYNIPTTTFPGRWLVAGQCYWRSDRSTAIPIATGSGSCDDDGSYAQFIPVRSF